MAQLASTRGGKLVTLCKRLGAGRQSVLRSLSALIEQGLVQRNPGYGHPMRPEFLPTRTGQAIGQTCEALLATVRALDVEALAFQKWSLPVVYALESGATRFRGIQRELPSVTSRALSLTLKNLEPAGVIERSVLDEHPPISTYGLTEPGTQLASLVTEVSVAL